MSISQETKIGLAFGVLLVTVNLILILFKLTGEIDLHWALVFLSPIGLSCMSFIIIMIMILMVRLIYAVSLKDSEDDVNEKRKQ